ncbi:MAG: IS701 family transposase [Desulfotomaculales bacterium]
MLLDPTAPDTTPLTGSLADLEPITVLAVDDTPWEPLWNHLMRTYHYLGHKKMPGCQMKQIAFSGGRPLVLAAWRAAALKLEARDAFIGWTPEQRRQFLPQVASNSRLLVLPWVKVPNLASYALARFIEALRRDWPAKYGRPLLLLETYVDPRYFTGTVYRAANWIFLGQTRGFTKQGRTYVYHGHPKEVYVYPLEPDFRDIIGCKRRPPRPPHRRHFSETRERAAVVLPSEDFSPAVMEEAGITEEDLDLLAGELVRFRDSFHEAFNRPAQRDHALVYLKGLLSDLGAKSVEPIALRYRGRSGVRSLQSFLKDSPWDEGKLSDLYQARLHGHLADEGGVLTVDSSEFPKKGKESVGVARQYCGRLGKVENCQSGVFVGYSSPKGYGLVSCRLYMPECWFTPEYAGRRQKTGVPEDLTFQTKAEIALELLRQVRASGRFPARWLACDAAFGRDSAFRDAVAAQGYWYLARVPSDTHVFTEAPRVEVPPYRGRGRPPCRVRPSPPPRTVAQVAADPDTPWRLVTLAEGAKGPIAAEVARLRVIESRGGLPAEEVWLFVRRDPDGAHQYWLSNAPAEVPLEEMARATALRWPIEQSFQEGKSELGMDHYELRSWRGWHRHMLYVFLAMLFLLEVRLAAAKKGALPPG